MKTKSGEFPDGMKLSFREITKIVIILNLNKNALILKIEFYSRKIESFRMIYKFLKLGLVQI